MIGGSPRIGGTSGRGMGIHPHPDSDGFSAGRFAPSRSTPVGLPLGRVPDRVEGRVRDFST